MTIFKRLITLGFLMTVMMVILLTGCQKDGANGEPAEQNHPKETVTASSDNGASPFDAPESVQSDHMSSGGDQKEDPAPTTDHKKGEPMSSLKGISALRLINDQSAWTGGQGWIARTDNSGKSWAVQAKPKGTIKQIFALDDQKAWVVTEELEIYRTRDGGKDWSKTSKAPNDGFLHFTSAGTGFIGHAVTRDGGETWHDLKIPQGTVGEVYFHDESIGWAVSQREEDSFQLMKTVDGGATWKKPASKKTTDPLGGVIIRSMGKQDAWLEVIGGSGMSQTAYTLFHTSDGGRNWLTVVANSTAGGGPAPGYPSGKSDAPKNEGVAPGPLYVVNRNTAVMGGYCGPCDKPNTVGRTKDGGRTWENSKQALEGSSGQLLAMTDESRGWMITLDSEKPAVLYKTIDGGLHWKKNSD